MIEILPAPERMRTVSDNRHALTLRRAKTMLGSPQFDTSPLIPLTQIEIAGYFSLIFNYLWFFESWQAVSF